MATGTALSLWQASRAERSRAAAEANYARARACAAVEKYLNSVTDHPRLQQADFQDPQRDLLETALPLYEEMSRDQGDDPRLLKDRMMALTIYNRACLLEPMPRKEEARTAYAEATMLLRGLVSRFPAAPDLQQQLASSEIALARIFSTDN